jgi:hypothetical protein
MDEIDIGLQYAKKKKRNRLNQNNIRRCNARSKLSSKSRATSSFGIEQNFMVHFNSMHLSTCAENNSSESHVLSCSTPVIHLHEQIVQNNDDHQSNDESDDLLFDDRVQGKEKPVQSLHQHTSVDCLSFSKSLISFIRKANISKHHTEQLINLIQSSLPQPNSLPSNYSGIINLLSGDTIYLFLFSQTSVIYELRSADTISYLEANYF